ncbi:alpha/beta fold hydrolase [Nonomuraea sp. NPDC049714]|uniref:alpha/beta fold hydrolase n=1 Tax=Nonomuraea sp. NPDC049714 TaxID=3364357 RepID=UPI0037AC8D51
MLRVSFVDSTVVHRFDQRGCGRSDPSDDQRMDRLVADFDNLRRHWGYDRWIVIGHAFGATFALAYAWTHGTTRPAWRAAAALRCSGTGVPRPGVVHRPRRSHAGMGVGR